MTIYNAENPLKILSLGWGVQSWTLAAMAALGEIPMPDYAVHADTTHEMAGTYAHAKKWTPWLEEHGVQVVTASANDDILGQMTGSAPSIHIPAFTTNLQGDRGQIQRQCTGHWKIVPIRRFIRTMIPRPRPGMVECWMGISLDEWHRMKDSDVKYIKNVYPLVERRISRASCVAWLESHGLDVPPKSACTFCPYHDKTSWKRIKKAGGADWAEAVAVDEAIRHKRPDHTTFIHSSTLPLEEAVRIPEDYGASQMEMDIPCDSGHCFV
tara:strand:+ start:182 stop:985 length:804 start_codon:yes stop_codon:yes gene_type:complete